MINVSEIAGVPLHYDRLGKPYNYGTRGRPQTFKADPQLVTVLDATFTELWEIIPYGRAEVITTAGIYADKPGYHRLGLAFDLDGIFWPGVNFIAFNFHTNPRLYLGIEAILRRHFKTVLSFHYDVLHRDHIHVQFDGPPALQMYARSNVLFLQAVATYLYNEPLEIDGKLGMQTSRFVQAHVPEKQGYLRWLQELAMEALTKGTRDREN